ncbi:MAG: hypothetical protein H7Y30_11775 [Pyrinomonadaceae bacterium]|nr:hypothetical protein [Pyrinomonadaceae bacterium]
MIDDPNPSMEFDRFEDIRRVLADVLMAKGHELLEAEKIALYVMEGLRDSSKLMTLLANDNSHTHEEILLALHELLNTTQALNKARDLLLGDEAKDEG